MALAAVSERKSLTLEKKRVSQYRYSTSSATTALMFSKCDNYEPELQSQDSV